MELHIKDATGAVRSLELESLITATRQVVWIGCEHEDAYNTVTATGYDPFQCSVVHDAQADTWTLVHGQLRTDCPKGLLSDRAKACSMCPGCCINPHPASPSYSHRHPKQSTLLNGTPVTEQGTRLIGGETVSVD
ncbi:MAG: hypothetical protein HUK02_04935 [Bacteroidaceae bacterium]|nr:hypothetical protein [Bacteroidaceae bacterium]